ncbi:MAG: transcription-repair coupling factor, partial [Dehalococcoidia bacterium]|nr:transcription-repair coupling factor [Dehalococcoidia bacterium]
YQLRGRVGRSANRAFAYFLYDRNRAISEAAQKRLAAIFEAAELGSGFQIALQDLEIRGAGNLLGAEQSGHIAAVGFDLFSKLVGEAVESLRGGLEGGGSASSPSLPPAPRVDLPVSASIPEPYVDDMETRLAIYERIAGIESPRGVAEMEEELRDRFGEPPPLVQNLLGVALLKAVGRQAGVERISTSPESFHLRLRGGTTHRHQQAVAALGVPGARVGPEQVRIPREQAGTEWMPLLARVLRALADAA